MNPSIKDRVHSKLLRLRALHRIVNSPAFDAAYKLDPNSAALEAALAEDSPEAVEFWINEVLERALEDLSLSELRKKAAALQIAYYASLTKATLILRILDARKAQENSRRLPDQGIRLDGEDASGIGQQVSVPAGSGRTASVTPRNESNGTSPARDAAYRNRAS